LFIIAAARPVFVVAAIDRFVAVSASEIEDADLAKGGDASFTSRSWSGPRLVGASAPKKETFELARSAAAGRDIEKLPQYYVSYDEATAAIMAHAKPLTVLAARGPAEAALVEGFLAQHQYAADAVVYIPLKGHDASFAMILSTQSRKPVGALAIDPW
jgi:hypothetical protein